jgi:hypothetical protein
MKASKLLFGALAALTFATLAAVALTACGDDSSAAADAGTPDAAPTFDQCEGSDEAFARQAMLAIDGRRPLSQGELDVYADLLKALRDKHGDTPEGRAQAKRELAYALAADPAYNARWQRHFLDKLRVQRIDDQAMRGCYGVTLRQPDTGALAAAVRDGAPMTAVPGGAFTMRDLLASAIALDDLTPVYRGNLFVLVSAAIPAANVPPVQAELARRADFGNTFDAVYLNRDIVCLGCHNTESSPTYRDDPAENRHWPLPGTVEKSIYGVSSGIDANRAHAMFRYDGFVDFGASAQKPWGWSGDLCGAFQPQVSPDPADVDAKFGSITGKTPTTYDAEASLARGFASLRQNGLVLGQNDAIADPDVAFAYLVTTNLVDGVWSEVTGNSLVIANHFPRNQASRDELKRLTDDFIASGFSLRALLADIVSSPYFNRPPLAKTCGASPYDMPAIYDPWVKSDPDAERRGNGAGDAIHALTTRTAAGAAYAALGWPGSPLMDFAASSESDCENAGCQELGFDCSQFGYCCAENQMYCVQHLPHPDPTYADDERAFQRGTGHFLKNAERGFRGLDFQARLEWEHRFGLCRAPAGLQPASASDFVDALLARAAAAPTATVRDLVLALKDRVLSEAFVDDAGERPALEALLGVSLDAPAAQAGEDGVRRVCGALLSSPQFLLGGSARQERDPVPLLTPPELGYGPVCQAVAGHAPAGVTITCAADGLTVQ